MNLGDKKSRKKVERRKILVEAAEEVIFTKGLEQATMDEIAEAAEFSKGTLYYYFEDKEDLYLAINNRGLTILNDRIASVITEDLTGVELIRRVGEEYIAFVQEHPHYFQAFAYHENRIQRESKTSELADQCEQQVHRAFNYTRRVLQIGMQDGTIDDRYDPQILAFELWSCIRGISQLYYLKSQGQYETMFGEFRVTFNQMFSNFMDIFLRGMQNGDEVNTEN